MMITFFASRRASTVKNMEVHHAIIIQVGRRKLRRGQAARQRHPEAFALHIAEGQFEGSQILAGK